MNELLAHFESFFNEAANRRTQLKKKRLPGTATSL
jgi:hypothetical protein